MIRLRLFYIFIDFEMSVRKTADCNKGVEGGRKCKLLAVSLVCMWLRESESASHAGLVLIFFTLLAGRLGLGGYKLLHLTTNSIIQSPPSVV